MMANWVGYGLTGALIILGITGVLEWPFVWLISPLWITKTFMAVFSDLTRFLIRQLVKKNIFQNDAGVLPTEKLTNIPDIPGIKK